MNKAMIIGNLGADPNVRHLPSGQVVAELRVATTERWTRDGERHERTEWHRCVLWGKAAENAGKYLAKGSKVYCEGRLQTREWTDHDNIKRYTTEIVIDRMEYLSTARGGGGEQAEGDSYSDAAPAGGGEADDDIPFDEPAPAPAAPAQRAAAPSSNRAPAKSSGRAPAKRGSGR